ncbi:MAG: hypothetical protein AAF253_02085 [Pseudomonadota bacterium]
MNPLKRLALAALALTCTACASMPTDVPSIGEMPWTVERPGMTGETGTSVVTGDIGADLITAPLVIRLEKACRQRGTRLSMDDYAVGPTLVRAGSEVSQSFTYTLCGRDADSIDGTLVSRIYYNGRPVSVRERDYRLTMGRWNVRFEALVPKGAPVGWYEMELQFLTEQTEHFGDRKPFNLAD